MKKPIIRVSTPASVSSSVPVIGIFQRISRNGIPGKMNVWQVCLRNWNLFIICRCGEKCAIREYKAGVVYLDNAATTRMAEEAEAAMQPYLVGKFGNASTTYGYGEEAAGAIAHAREVIAASLDARPSEIYFYIGGIGGRQLGHQGGGGGVWKIRSSYHHQQD